MNKQKLKEVMSELGKLSAKKKPKDKAHFQMMQKKSLEAKRRKKSLNEVTTD